MPIEIRELVIRVNVVDNQAAEAPKVDVNAIKREVIEDCLRYLQNHKEKNDDR